MSNLRSIQPSVSIWPIWGDDENLHRSVEFDEGVRKLYGWVLYLAWLASQVDNTSTAASTTTSQSIHSTSSTSGGFPAEWTAIPDDALNIVIDRLWELQDSEGEDDEVPSLSTIITALEMLAEAADHVSTGFPRAAASTDGNGAVYLFWTKPDRMLQLTIPKDEDRDPFIYHRKGDKYGFVRPASAEELADWLNWYIAA